MAWLAQYMESHGVEVDLRDHCGHSPLHLAARAGHASAVAILVAHGADVTAKVFLFFLSFFSQSFLTFLHLSHQPPTPKLVPFILLFKKKIQLFKSGLVFIYYVILSFFDNIFFFSLLFDLGGVVDEAKRERNSSRELFFLFLSQIIS